VKHVRLGLRKRQFSAIRGEARECAKDSTMTVGSPGKTTDIFYAGAQHTVTFHVNGRVRFFAQLMSNVSVLFDRGGQWPVVGINHNYREQLCGFSSRWTGGPRVGVVGDGSTTRRHSRPPM
jgi:hypothetical protein